MYNVFIICKGEVRMRRRILAIILAVCMLAGAMPVAAFASAKADVSAQTATEQVQDDESTPVKDFFISLYYRFKSVFDKIGTLFRTLFTRSSGAEVETVEKEDTAEIAVDPSESSLYDSALYAHRIKNSVQSSYTDTARNGIRFENSDIKLTHSLTSAEKSATLTDRKGNIYIEDSFSTYYADRLNVKHYFEKSGISGRVNNIRLGEYYYDCHVRDFEVNGFKVDKNYHVYSDRLYQQYYLYSSLPTTAVREFGFEVKLPVKDVAKIQIKDKNGIHDSVKGIDEKSVEYAAFDVIGTGIIGFIIPSDGSTLSVEVEKGLKYYTLTQKANYEPFTGINKNDETGGYELNYVTFGSRIYTDSSHNFTAADAAAFEERHPLTEISVGQNNANAQYLDYDALRGAYTFRMDGTGFQYAYDNPELQYRMPVTVKGDELDREIFIRSFGAYGCLEAAALLDSDGLLSPIDVELCKNFQGDGGEGFYSVKDYQYGDSFFPLRVGKNEDVSFTLLNLYQNWGKYPLKQLSSIEFHVSYYHLSTGTTESNCIAPYFVYQKDGWSLPDFRCRSGNIWATQPQFNSTGILKFMAQKDVLSEFKGSIINSCGQTYADVTDYYVSDDGAFDYSVRHVEFPQTDENRTYYTLNVRFNKDITYKDFRSDFDLFYFDGRFVKFNKLGYLDSDNNCRTADVDTGKGVKYYTLGSEYPYYGLYNITDDTEHYIDECIGCNFALIVRNSRITVNGVEQNIPFTVRDSSTKDITIGCLTLDAEKLSFKKGDTIGIDMILLPWGVGREETDDNVRTVREDSAFNPVSVDVKTGEKTEDTYLPIIRAENNQAEFTLKGGRNNNAVRVDGITSLSVPKIYRLADGEWQRVELASSNGYDGYSIRIGDDGKYSVSFIYNAADPYQEYTFRVVCE